MNRKYLELLRNLNWAGMQAVKPFGGIQGKLLGVMEKPKFSIIIPAKGGMPYLKYAIKSVLGSQLSSLELIVSVDDTQDGTAEFLAEIEDPRLRVISPPNGLSMSEHWDFAQSHASGQWQMFLGQDDMVVRGFERAFESLTAMATEEGLEAIVSRRAYITWPPIATSNLKALQYWRTEEIKVLDSQGFALSALLSSISYHEGPQMYTTTLVSKKLIEKIRESNSGKLIMGHPQDAFLAASILRHAPQYLWSGEPFGWVGTSSKSAGLAITHNLLGDPQKDLASSYAQSVSQSTSLPYASKLDFRHGVNARYFLDALAVVWPDFINRKVKNSTLTQFRFDVNQIANINQKSSKDFKILQLVWSPRFVILKQVLGSGLMVWRKFLAFGLSLAASFVEPRLRRKYHYLSIQRESNLESLYKASVHLGGPA